VFMIFSSKGLANSFALKNFIPNMSLDNLTYLPVVIYSFMGFELMSSVGDSIQNPKKDIPKMILFSGVAILFIYVFATFGVLAAIPVHKVVIETGIVDALLPAFKAAFGVAARPIFIVVALGVMFTFIGNMVTWSIGSNESLAATGMDETAPGIFGHRHAKWDTPDYAFILMGVIATATTVLTYVLLNQASGAFWVIFVLSSVVFLLPYLLMFPALIRLRQKFPDHPRPYRVPWGNFGLWLWTILCEVGIIFTLALFFLAPDPTIPSGVYYGVVIGASVASIAVGFILYFRSKGKIDKRYIEDQKQEQDLPEARR